MALENRARAIPVNDLLQLHYEGLPIEEANRTYETITQRVCMRDLNEHDPNASSRAISTPSALYTVALQRTMDRLVAFILLVLCLPAIAILTALLLRLISWEPAFIKSRRAGYNGKPFNVLRFRAEPKFRWLYRRFHLDAMPELVNVLRGEMALVGPGPESPETAASRSR